MSMHVYQDKQNLLTEMNDLCNHFLKMFRHSKHTLSIDRFTDMSDGQTLAIGIYHKYKYSDIV